MAAASEVTRLTEAYRREQVRRATLIAALVAAYYRRRVAFDSAASIQAWIDLMVPRILKASDDISDLAVGYATALRRLEVPTAIPFAPSKVPGSVAEQIERSLRVVGPEAHLDKMTDIRRLDVGDVQRKALEKQAMKDAITKVTGSALRHAQAGGRNTLQAAAREDPVALGWVRVTRDKPCFFCAMLASRGIDYGENSFDGSDPRFQGPGNAKVHDSCRCTMKPVFDRFNDPLVQRSEKFEEQWLEWGVGTGSQAILNFRRGYEGRSYLISV